MEKIHQRIESATFFQFNELLHIKLTNDKEKYMNEMNEWVRCMPINKLVELYAHEIYMKATAVANWKKVTPKNPIYLFCVSYIVCIIYG